MLEFAAQLLELSDCTIVRVATQQKSVWWLFRFGGLDDGECSAHRTSRLTSRVCAEPLPARASGRLIILDVPRALAGRTAGPIGAKAAGLDQHDLDAQRLDFLPECLRQSLNGVLAGIVVTELREAGGNPPDDTEFFRRVAGTLGETSGILIAGPENAKTAFKTYMDHLRPYNASQVFTVETIYQPSDEALLSLGREHFEINGHLVVQNEQTEQAS